MKAGSVKFVLAGLCFAAAVSSADLEKAAYLGVGAAPADAAMASQIGLPPGFGLVVNRVDAEGGASDAVRMHDILMMLDDQHLVNQEQLTALVRSRKPGDEVKLSLRREGKPLTVTATLVEKELPPFSRESGRTPSWSSWTLSDWMTNLNARASQPGVPDGRPRRGAFSRRTSSVSSSVANGRMTGRVTTTDAEGRTVTLNETDGDRRLSVTDSSGAVLFEGPVNTDDERNAVPAEYRDGLREMEGRSAVFLLNDGGRSAE